MGQPATGTAIRKQPGTRKSPGAIGSLAKFTPSILPAETLEAIFVERGPLLNHMEELVRESALTENKHFFLLYGPRGSGKTHLISLLCHRTRQTRQVDKRLKIAWLLEEEWGLDSLREFLTRILHALVREYGDNGQIQERIEAACALDSEGAELRLGQILQEAVEGRTLLVLIENLDEAFSSMGPDEQSKLRAYLQNHSFVAIAATSQRLFRGVTSRSAPFYGFFEIRHLPPFTFEEAFTLLEKVAQHHGDEKTLQELRSPAGRGRIRAIHLLAGGNPRIYVIFSQFLTQKDAGMATFAELVTKTLDDLTPYYQSRMKALPAQQRKIIEYLCRKRHAVNVKKIAEDTFLKHQVVSSQLKRLADLGFVRSHSRGRCTWYELGEPLMRHAMDVKRQRGERIELLVNFFAIWFSHDEMARRLRILAGSAAFERRLIVQAMQAIEKTGDPVVRAALEDYKAGLDEADWGKALDSANELCNRRGEAEDWIKHAYVLKHKAKYADALKSCIRATQADAGVLEAWLARADLLLFDLARPDDALKSYDQALRIDPNHSAALVHRAVALRELKREKQAAQTFQKVLELPAANAEQLLHRGFALESLQRFSEALEAYDQALQQDSANPKIWLNRGYALAQLDHTKEALASYKKAQELDSDNPWARLNQGALLDLLGCYEEAIETLKPLLEPPIEHPKALEGAGIISYRMGRFEQSRDYLKRACELSPRDADLWCSYGISLGAVEQLEAAREAFERSIQLNPAHDFHRDSNYASILMALGLWEEGSEKLSDALRPLQQEKSPDTEGEIAIMRNLLIRLPQEPNWKRIVSVYADQFAKRRLLPLLGQGLVRSIKMLAVLPISLEMAEDWYRTWREQAGVHRDMSLPLKFVEVAIRYLKERKPQVLYDLPSEQGALLKQLLGIEEDFN